MKKKFLTLLICFACVLASFSTGFSLFAAEEPGEANITFTPDYSTEHTTYNILFDVAYYSGANGSRKGYLEIYDNQTKVQSVSFETNSSSAAAPLITTQSLVKGKTYRIYIIDNTAVQKVTGKYYYDGDELTDYSLETAITGNNIPIEYRKDTSSNQYDLSLTVTEQGYAVTVNDVNLPTNYDRNISGTFEAADGYTLPETITVIMGGQVVQNTAYSYDSDTGAFSIGGIAGDIEITADAVEYPTVTINSNEEYTTTLPDHIIAGGNLSGTIFPDDEDLIIRKIEVEMVGNTSELVNYTFDRESGLFYLPGVTGDVTIELTIGEPPTQAELLGDSIGGFISQLWDWLTDGAEAIVTSPILLVILVAIPIGSLVIYFIVRLIKRGSR